MARRTALTVSLFSGCLGCVLLVGRTDSAEPSAAQPYKPVASVRGLMAGQDILFKRLQQALDDANAADRIVSVQLTSEVLAELANVNTYNSEKEDYRAWASQLRATAMELSEEAKKKSAADDARMKRLFVRIEATCHACHEAYQ